MKKAIIHQHYPLDYAGEEALNSICTNLAFIGTDKRKIVITSNSQSEGKSWMTMHIAENMARRGRQLHARLRRCGRPFLRVLWPTIIPAQFGESIPPDH